jgi:hypothetical protein
MDNELLEALLSVQPGKGITGPNEHWRKLFNYYNSNKSFGSPHLSMSCQPCYDKVYELCRKELLKQVVISMKPTYNPNNGMESEASIA